MTTRVYRATEYRLVVPGRAVSFRSKHAKSYKDLVSRLAFSLFSAPASGEEMEVRIDYFHSSRRDMDMDNIAKCILDALNGIAYVDDQQVSLQSAAAHSLLSIVNLPQGPVDLVKPLAQFEEYTMIRIRKSIEG